MQHYMLVLFILFCMLSNASASEIDAIEVTPTHYGMGYEQRMAIINKQKARSLTTKGKVSLVRVQKIERPVRPYRPQRPVRPGR